MGILSDFVPVQLGFVPQTECTCVCKFNIIYRMCHRHILYGIPYTLYIIYIIQQTASGASNHLRSINRTTNAIVWVFECMVCYPCFSTPPTWELQCSVPTKWHYHWRTAEHQQSDIIIDEQLTITHQSTATQATSNGQFEFQLKTLWTHFKYNF